MTTLSELLEFLNGKSITIEGHGVGPVFTLKANMVPNGSISATQEFGAEPVGERTRPFCEICGGTGWKGHGMAGDTCGDCNGTGLQPINSTPLARPYRVNFTHLRDAIANSHFVAAAVNADQLAGEIVTAWENQGLDDGADDWNDRIARARFVQIDDEVVKHYVRPTRQIDVDVPSLGTDARKWAGEFCRIYWGKLRYESDAGEFESWIFGWMANAIEAGRSAAWTDINKESPNFMAGYKAGYQDAQREENFLLGRVRHTIEGINSRIEFTDGALILAMAAAGYAEGQTITVDFAHKVLEQLKKVGDDVEPPTHYVYFNGAAHFVKEASFFAEQGGLIADWGKAWRPVVATDIDEARKISMLMNWDDKKEKPKMTVASRIDSKRALEAALKDWLGEMAFQAKNRMPDGTPYLGKHETEEVYRTAKRYLELRGKY